MRRGLPGDRPRRRRRRAARGHRWRHRHSAHRRRPRGLAQVGERLRAHRRMHQGLRLRGQSAFPARHGAGRDGAAQGRAARPAPPRRRGIPQGRARGHPYLADAAQRRAPGAPGPERQCTARLAAGFRVLHRLQRAQDPAHRAACPRHHGRARRHLPGAGRAEPLLRHRADANGRRRDLRPVR